ncbi:hypothetical protein [Tsuneonella suprasediminis]|uniref:hypothetical protein n=1 Tax=Tsuneonella suprasediminis TaxID=2306996 RepID=UPI002F93C859
MTEPRPALIDPRLWETSRAGARSGRGFRFQDAVGAWLGLQIWAGKLDADTLVPEGLDDITLHKGEEEFRVQVKARHDPRGTFSSTEIVQHLVKAVGTVDENALKNGRCRLVLVLERQPAEIEPTGLEHFLAEDGHGAQLLMPMLSAALDGDRALAELILTRASVVTIPDPIDEAVTLLTSQRTLPDAIGRLVAHKLRFLVGEGADLNYLASASHPFTIGSSDVEAILTSIARLVAREDLFPAIERGLCHVLNFDPVTEEEFYTGVDALPGHVAGGLVLDRPELVSTIEDGLQRQGVALVAGPSGAGKSAAAWLAAFRTRHAIRWYRLGRPDPADVSIIVELAQSLEASPERPVGFIIDDVGRDLSGVWEILARELRHHAGVVLLGTIREEDLFLAGDLASTAIVRPALDEALAQRIWSELRSQQEVFYQHWREPFELSEGLLLEYTHLLSRGQRLGDTLADQLRRRLREERDDEIAILQAVIPAARFGGRACADRVRQRLGLASGSFARAIARLEGEHAIRLGNDNTLAGLHRIRSQGLYEQLSLQCPTSSQAEIGTLTDVLLPDDFTQTLPSLLEYDDVDAAVIEGLSLRVPSLSMSELAFALHALGLASCSRTASRWLAVIEEEGLESRHAGLAFSLAMVRSEIDVPQFARMNSAIRRFPEAFESDLRVALLARMDSLPATISAQLDAYHELAAALVPLSFLNPAPEFSSLPALDEQNLELSAILPVAATLREFGPQLAEDFVALFGGSTVLLKRIHRECSWVTEPSITDTSDGLVVTSHVRFMGDAIHGNGNDAVVEHCERLLAALPSAEVACSDLLGWDGEPAGFENCKLATKRIPRENLPTPVRVAWNRGVLRTIQGKVGSETESGRANTLFAAIEELADLLQDAGEVYCRGIPAPTDLPPKLQARALLNSFISPPARHETTRSALDGGSWSVADETYDFVFAVTKLAWDLLADIDRPLLQSTEAAKLAREASSLLDADDWRWLEQPPREALETLGQTLDELDAVLGDSHRFPDAFRRSRMRAERSSQRNRSRVRFANDAKARAAAEADRIGEAIRSALQNATIEAKVFMRPMDDRAAPYWPRVEFVVVLPVDHLVNFMEEAERFTRILSELPDTHKVTVAPLREGIVVGDLAGVVFKNFLPDVEFAAKWKDHIALPLLERGSARILAEIMDVMLQISGVLANLDRELNEDEMAHAQKLVDELKATSAPLAEMQARTDDEDIAATCRLVSKISERLQRELDGGEEESISLQFARMMNGEPSEFTTEIIGYRIGLLELDIQQASSEIPTTSNVAPDDLR